MDFGMLNDVLVAATGEISGFMYTYILVFFAGDRRRLVQRADEVRSNPLHQGHVHAAHREEACERRAFDLVVSGSDGVDGISRGHGQHRRHRHGRGHGRPGAIFWMWLMALIGAASAFVESTLAQIWKVRGADGEFRGGPAYYIQQALGKRWLGIIFAWALILCFAFGFNGLQSCNMASALEYYIPDYATNGTAIALGIVLAVMTAFVIFGGAKRISIITSVIVPVMALAYIALAVWTTVTNLGEIRPCSRSSSPRLSISSRSSADSRARLSCSASSAACSPIGRHGLGPERRRHRERLPPGEAGVWCRACRSTSTRCSSARARL